MVRLPDEGDYYSFRRGIYLRTDYILGASFNFLLYSWKTAVNFVYHIQMWYLMFFVNSVKGRRIGRSQLIHLLLHLKQQVFYLALSINTHLLPFHSVTVIQFWWCHNLFILLHQFRYFVWIVLDVLHLPLSFLSPNSNRIYNFSLNIYNFCYKSKSKFK